MTNLKLTAGLTACLTLCGGVADAALIDRGGGLIYDDVLDVTWLQDANYTVTSGYDDDGLMTWQEALAWATQLQYAGVDDWRLPVTRPIDGRYYQYHQSYGGNTDLGWNISAPGSPYAGSTGSELAYLFHNDLGNISWYDIYGRSTGCVSAPEYCLSNAGPFIGMHAAGYWSGTEYPLNFDSAFHFRYQDGFQALAGKDFMTYAMAVHDGDIGAVPIPAAAYLFGSGLLGIIGFGRRKASRNWQHGNRERGIQ